MRPRRRAAALALAALLLGGAAELASTPLSRMDLPWWKARFAAKQAELQRGRIDLVWYGDSITQNWERNGPQPWYRFAPIWQHYYGDRHAIDLGFKGDTTAHLLWRIEHGEADGIHPKAAIVLIGANNFGKLHWPAAPTFRGIEAVVAALRARLPNTGILLLGVLPSIRSAWVDENTAELNRRLAARYAHEPNVIYRDVSVLFLKGGRVDPTRFLDPHLTPPDPPLHPSPEAQAALAAMIEPDVARLMSDRLKS